MKAMDWERAGKHLQVCEEYYAGLRGGELALNTVILPLSRRFSQGERAPKLFREIMTVRVPKKDKQTACGECGGFTCDYQHCELCQEGEYEII